MAKYATELREAVLRQVLSGDMTLTDGVGRVFRTC